VPPTFSTGNFAPQHSYSDDSDEEDEYEDENKGKGKKKQIANNFNKKGMTQDEMYEYVHDMWNAKGPAEDFDCTITAGDAGCMRAATNGSLDLSKYNFWSLIVTVETDHINHKMVIAYKMNDSIYIHDIPKDHTKKYMTYIDITSEDDTSIGISEIHIYANVNGHLGQHFNIFLQKQ